MEISTKYNINQDVFYVERERVAETCSTCKGKKIINVTNGVHCWNIMCPDCNGQGKAYSVIHHRVAGGTIKEIIARRANHKKAFTKYELNNGGGVKKEEYLFADKEEAEKQCSYLNDQIERNKKKTQ